jgi:hypothetical protein
MTLNQHIRATLVIGGPLIGGQLAQTLISLTDTVMMGWYGAEELAAVALGASFFHVILIVGMGFALAVMPMVAASSVNGDAVQVRRVTRMGLWLGIGFGVLSLPAFWFSGPILLALGQEPQVAANGQLYLRDRGVRHPSGAAGARPALASVGAGAPARGALGLARGGGAQRGAQLGPDLRQSGRAGAGRRGGGDSLGRDAGPDPLGARPLRGPGAGAPGLRAFRAVLALRLAGLLRRLPPRLAHRADAPGRKRAFRRAPW